MKKSIICCMLTAFLMCGCSVDNKKGSAEREQAFSAQYDEMTEDDTKSEIDIDKLVYPEYTEDELLNISDDELRRLCVISIYKDNTKYRTDEIIQEHYFYEQLSASSREEAETIAKERFTAHNDSYLYSNMRSVEEKENIGWLYAADYSNHNVQNEPTYCMIFSSDFFDNERLIAESTQENFRTLLLCCFPQYEDGLGCFMHESPDRIKAVKYYARAEYLDAAPKCIELFKTTITLNKQTGEIEHLTDKGEYETVKIIDYDIMKMREISKEFIKQ